MSRNPGLAQAYQDIWLLDGVRTPFADYMGALADVSPIDLGIKVAKDVLKKAEMPASDIGTVVAGNMAQASYDAYMLPRHVGLYAGVPLEVPAHLVQRVCGTGIEAIMQAAGQIQMGQTDAGLVVGAESMSRNPVAAYTHRNGFRMGQVEFKDFLWEALIDPAPGIMMGDTAENLAREYQITR
ncbi:MAG: acetyl-CoA C-acyltransferase, partial [Ferrovibrio sp.]